MPFVLQNYLQPFSWYIKLSPSSPVTSFQKKKNQTLTKYLLLLPTNFCFVWLSVIQKTYLPSYFHTYIKIFSIIHSHAHTDNCFSLYRNLPPVLFVLNLSPIFCLATAFFLISIAFICTRWNWLNIQTKKKKLNKIYSSIIFCFCGSWARILWWFRFVWMRFEIVFVVVELSLYVTASTRYASECFFLFNI